MTCKACRPILTRRELEVLRLIATGREYSQISLELEIAMDTVKSHCKNIYSKLGAHNAPHAVSIAIGQRLVFPQDPVIGGGTAMGPAANPERTQL